MHWVYRLFSDREWSGRYAVSPNPAVNSICISRSSLDVAFDDKGRQTGLPMARVSGAVAGLTQVFIRCGWQMEPQPGKTPATIHASELIRSLLRSTRPSGLAQAIMEVGRVNKTLYHQDLQVLLQQGITFSST